MPQAINGDIGASPANNWRLIAGLAAGAYVLGVWGYFLMLAPSGGTLLDSAYRTINLFRMNYAGQGPIPWQLEMSRFLAPLVTLLAAGKIAASVLREKWGLVRIRWFWRDHHIVIGSSEYARMLVEDIIMSGEKVAFVSDRPCDNSDDSLWKRNCVVIPRTSGDDAAWLATRLDTAATLTIASDDDEHNLATMHRAKDWCETNRPLPPEQNQLKAYCRFKDNRIGQLLRDRTDLFQHLPQVAISAFNPFQRAARLLLLTHPLVDRIVSPMAKPHILLLGSSTLAENMIVWIAMTGHFANDGVARITLFDVNASDSHKRILLTYPGIETLVDLVAVDDDPEIPDKQNMDAVTAELAITCAYFCGNSDVGNLLSANRWTRHLVACKRIVVFERPGHLADFTITTALQLDEGAGNSCLDTFEFVARTCTRNAIMQDDTDRLARQVHSNYYMKELAEPDGKRRGDTASMYPWEELSEEWRDDNRAQVDHIIVKLKTIGASIALLPKSDRDFSFSENEIELLARMEHQRWIAQKIMCGWRFSLDRNDKQRLHPCLVPWEQLSEVEKERDRRPVRAIPEILKLDGCGVRRNTAQVSG